MAQPNESAVRVGVVTFAHEEDEKAELTIDPDSQKSSKISAVSQPLRSRFFTFSSARFHLSLLLCLGTFSINFMRSNFSMAVVCMVNSTALALMREDSDQVLDNSGALTYSNHSSTSPAEDCKLTRGARLEYEGSFIWTSEQQAVLFSAVFWGGLLSGFPSGWLADRYGPKNLMLVSVLSNIVGSVLTPVAATHGGYIALFIVRFCMGIGQGVQYPCICAMIARWYPPEERSTVVAIYTAGNQLASIIGMPFNAWLCQHKEFLDGWPSIFYLAGGFGLIWSLIWVSVVRNSPEKSRKISAVEKQYIAHRLSSQSLRNRKLATKHIPWAKIVCAGPLIANHIAGFTGSFVGVFLATYIPTFFKDVLFLDLKSNGFLSALPFVTQWISKCILGPVSDALKRKTDINHTKLCKVFNSIGSFGPAAFFVAISFVSCSQPGLAVFFLCCISCTFSALIPGYLTSLISIAPQYSGVVNSVNMVNGQLSALLTPFVVGAITMNGNHEEWRIVFLLLAAVSTVSGIVFILFGSAEIQPWAKAPESSISQISLPTTESSKGLVTTEDDVVVVSSVPDLIRKVSFDKASNSQDATNEVQSDSDEGAVEDSGIAFCPKRVRFDGDT